MDNYFENVYLKRMNIDGDTQQDRVKTRKEKEFDLLFLKKTEYQAVLELVNDDEPRNEYVSLQPNQWNEKSIISNLLVSTHSKPLKTGDILLIKQKIKDFEQEKQWLVIFVEENLTKGYWLYKIICLDTTINLTDEYGTSKYVFPAKITNASTTFNVDTFIHSATQLGYREPFSTRIVITKDFSFLKKAMYFDYKERGFEIASIDNLSVDGVAYMTISERLITEPEPLSSKDIMIGEDQNFFLNGGAGKNG